MNSNVELFEDRPAADMQPLLNAEQRLGGREVRICVSVVLQREHIIDVVELNEPNYVACLLYKS